MWEFVLGWTGIGTLAAVVAAVALFVGARGSETRNAGRHAATQEQVAGVEGRLTVVGGRLTGIEGRLTGVEGGLTGVEGRLTGVEENVGTLTTTVAEGFEALKEQIGNLQPHAADESEIGHTDTAGNIIVTDPDTTEPENVAATGPGRLPAGTMGAGSFPAQSTRGPGKSPDSRSRAGGPATRELEPGAGSGEQRTQRAGWGRAADR